MLSLALLAGLPGTLLAFMIVSFSVMYLRKSRPDLHRPYRTPWVPFVPVAGILTCGYLIVTMFLGTQPLDEAYYLAQYPDAKAAIESGEYQNAVDHYQQKGRAENRRPYNPDAPESAKEYRVLTPSGREILKLIPWYLLVGAAIYLFYGQFHSRLGRGLEPREGDPEFVHEIHEIRTD